MPVLSSLAFKQWRWLLSCGWHWLMPKCVCTCSLGAQRLLRAVCPSFFFFSLPFWSYMSACASHVGWVYQHFYCLLGWIQLLQVWRFWAVDCTCCGSSFGQPQYCACSWCTHAYTFWSGILQIPDVLGLLNFWSFHFKVGLENSFLTPHTLPLSFCCFLVYQFCTHLFLYPRVL